MDNRTDDVIADRYRIERRLGAGGVGAVHPAYATFHDRPCALEQFSIGQLPSEDETRLHSDRAHIGLGKSRSACTPLGRGGQQFGGHARGPYTGRQECGVRADWASADRGESGWYGTLVRRGKPYNAASLPRSSVGSGKRRLWLAPVQPSCGRPSQLEAVECGDGQIAAADRARVGCPGAQRGPRTGDGRTLASGGHDGAVLLRDLG